MKRRDFVIRAGYGAAGFGILRTLAACQTVPSAIAYKGTFAQLRDRYFLFSLRTNPVTSTYLGGDGYSPELALINGKLRDYRPAAIAAELAFYSQTRAELLSINRIALSRVEGVDFDLMRAQLDFLIRQLGESRYHQRAVDTYVAEPFRGIDWQIQQMEDAGGGLLGTPEEWELVITRTLAVPAYLATARANLLAGKQSGRIPDRRMIQRDGINGSGSNAVYFRTTLPATSAKLIGQRAFGPGIRARLDSAAAIAARSWEEFAGFLAQTYDVNETVDRYAAGQTEYEWRVRNVLGDSRTAAQLYDYGAQETAAYTRRIFEVAEKLAREARLGIPFNTDAEKYAGVRAVMAFLSKDSPKNDEQLFKWYREAGVRLVAYGRQYGLFDIPSDYRLDVVETPPVLRSTIDAAYYPAPPFKTSGVGRFYLTPTGNDPAALKENNFASVADLAIHEGFPGHDWHYKYMTANRDRISNIRWLTPGAVEDSSSMWSDSMAAEGWALYVEEMMSEPRGNSPYGFFTAGEFLYELQGQLMRAVRVRVDVGIHTGRMTFDEAVDYFAERVLFQPNARQRAASEPAARAAMDSANRAIFRYSKWPTQAITYNLGKAAIRDLRDAYRARQGSAYSAKRFHEKFMSMGTIPVKYFRDSFLETQ